MTQQAVPLCNLLINTSILHKVQNILNAFFQIYGQQRIKPVATFYDLIRLTRDGVQHLAKWFTECTTSDRATARYSELI